MRLWLASSAALASLMMISAGPAHAADLPYEAPAAEAVVVPSFTWSGVYVGGAVGYAFSDLDVRERDFRDFRYKDEVDSILGTAFVGVNYQFDSIVVGAEADITLGDFGGKSRGCPNDGAFTFRCRADADDLFGTIRGRVGFAFDRVLVFATGGLAIGGEVDFRRDASPGILGGGFGKDSSGTRYGYALGGGVEFAVTDNVIVRGEYQYVDFGQENFRLENSIGATQRVRVEQDLHIVRAGVAYKF